MSIQSNILQNLSVASLLIQRSPMAQARREAAKTSQLEADLEKRVSALEGNLPEDPEERQQALEDISREYKQHFETTGSEESLKRSREYQSKSAEAGREVQARQEAAAAAEDALRARQLETEKSAAIRSSILEGVIPDIGLRERWR